jgi:hypothetical protein
MPNIILLYGNDEFAIARKLKEFESDFSDATTADMNTTRLLATPIFGRATKVVLLPSPLN